MSTPSTGAPEAAVEAVARNKWNRAPHNLEPNRLEQIVSDLESAYPAILADLKERLLENDAQVAAFKAAGVELSGVEPPTPESLRRALEAGTKAAFNKATEGHQ